MNTIIAPCFAPETRQETTEALLGRMTGKELRDVVALGLLDIEANVLDTLGPIELEHLIGCIQTLVRQDQEITWNGTSSLRNRRMPAIALSNVLRPFEPHGAHR